MGILRNDQTKARMKSIWKSVKPKALNVTLGLLIKSFTALYHDLSEPPFKDIDP